MEEAFVIKFLVNHPNAKNRRYGARVLKSPRDMFHVIHRRETQGTRSEGGRTWCERIWTVIATCEQQQRSIFEYLCGAVHKYFHSEPAP